MAFDLSFGGTAFPRAEEVRAVLYNHAVKGMSARFRQLDRLDAFGKNLEYSHLTVDWNGFPADQLEAISPNATMVQPMGFTTLAAAQHANLIAKVKRPTAPLRLCPLVVNRFTGLLFSEERRPTLSVEGDEQSEDFLNAIVDDAGFWGKMHAARYSGGSQGGVLLTVHLKDGRFSFEQHPAKIVQDIQWADRARMVPAGALIQYIALEEYMELDRDGRPTGNTRTEPMLHRRIIDEEVDLVFKPAPIEEDGELPELEVDEERTDHHKLGFFPGRWIQNLPSDDGIDGIPDCDGAFQMIETIDRLLSQANYALLANLDPTLVISRDKKLDQSGVIMKGSDNSINVGLQGSANYLEITGEGIKLAIEMAHELKQSVLDTVQCVLADPEKITGAAQSGYAIELIYHPMLEKAGRLRGQYGPAITGCFEVVLAMARDHLEHPEKLASKDIPNPKPYFRLPPKIEALDADPDDPDAKPQYRTTPRMPGPGGTISLKWGRYFLPTVSDVQTQTTTLALAKTAEIIDTDTAIRQGAPLFGQKDEDALLRRVREEQKKKEDKLREMTGVGGDDGGGSLVDQYREQMGGVTQKQRIKAKGLSVALPKPAEQQKPSPRNGQEH